MTPTTFDELRQGMWDLHDAIKQGLPPELAARRLETLVDGLALAQFDPGLAARESERSAAARALAWRCARAYERAQVVGYLRQVGRLAGPSPVRVAMERAASAIDVGDHGADVDVDF